MSDTLQVSEVVERLEAYTSDWRDRAASAVPITIAITLLRTLQSENEALRAAGEEARRALAAIIHSRRNSPGLMQAYASKAHRGLEEVLGDGA